MCSAAEPARVLSLSAECLASAEHHARLSDRLATSRDGVVPQDVCAAAQRQPPLTAAICLRGVALLRAIGHDVLGRCPCTARCPERARLLLLSADCPASAEHRASWQARRPLSDQLWRKTTYCSSTAAIAHGGHMLERKQHASAASLPAAKRPAVLQWSCHGALPRG